MPGFTTHNQSVHDANGVTGFRNAGKGKRHRWDLKSGSKPKLPAVPKSHALDTLDHTATHGDMTDSPLSGFGSMLRSNPDDGDGADAENMMDALSEPGQHNPDIHALPQPPSAPAHHAPVAVHIHLDPGAHAAFKSMAGKKKRFSV